MKVTIRQKPISNNRHTLYLDFYPAIINPITGKATRRDFLNLYIFDKARNPLDKKHNKETLELAENIRSKRQLEIQANDYGFLKRNNTETDFLEYFKTLSEIHKEKGGGDKHNWTSSYIYLFKFTNGNCLAENLTEKFCEDFKAYLLQVDRKGRTKKKLSKNSSVVYFNIFKRVVKMAYKNKMIEFDPTINIKSIPKTETQREFLSLDEVRLLAKTPCEDHQLKQAALFSCLTGLRYSDIEKLTWEEIKGDSKSGYNIRYTQKKTKGVETLPISNDAFKLLEKQVDSKAKIFPNLYYSSWQNQKLQEWVYKAGVFRKISFHSFRHSFATIQLTLGTDIYTVSKMLGHKDLHTTQIYAKVIDKTKREAADKIKLVL